MFYISMSNNKENSLTFGISQQIGETLPQPFVNHHQWGQVLCSAGLASGKWKGFKTLSANKFGDKT